MERDSRRRAGRQDDFQARERTILSAALKEFCGRGYDAASISAIAQAAGVSDGLLYKHFDGKEHLLYEAIAFRYRDDVDRAVAEIDRVSGAWPRLERFVRLHLRAWQESPEFYLLFFHETRRAPHRYSEIVQQPARTYVRRLEAILTEGMAAGVFAPDLNVRFIRDFLIGGLDHTVWWHVAQRHELDVAALADQAMAYLLPNLLTEKGRVEVSGVAVPAKNRP